MEELAPAKLNLFLHITGRREDGYHLLESLVAFCDVADRLTAEPSCELSMEITGPFSSALKQEQDNLILRAARELQKAAGVPKGVRLTLEKHIPVGAGLGGGSADAAASLRLLPKFWGVEIEREQLESIALGLGADVPACLDSRPSLMQGIGERLTPVSLPAPLPLLLVNPRIPVSTAEIFHAIAGKPFTSPLTIPRYWESSEALLSWLADTGNDLQEAAIKKVPVISQALSLLKQQQGSKLARMSGSGATCFAVFHDETAAQKAQAVVKQTHPDWWVKVTSRAFSL